MKNKNTKQNKKTNIEQMVCFMLSGSSFIAVLVTFVRT